MTNFDLPLAIVVLLALISTALAIWKAASPLVGRLVLALLAITIVAAGGLGYWKYSATASSSEELQSDIADQFKAVDKASADADSAVDRERLSLALRRADDAAGDLLSGSSGLHSSTFEPEPRRDDTQVQAALARSKEMTQQLSAIPDPLDAAKQMVLFCLSAYLFALLLLALVVWVTFGFISKRSVSVYGMDDAPVEPFE